MMTNLMTISVKKASISSKLTTVYLSCPPLCGLFSIQQNAKGGLSYKVKKNPACRILRLRRVALATFFHSAAVRSLAERFLCHRTKFPMTIRVSKDTLTFIDFCLYLENLTRIDFRIGYLENLQNANLVFFILIMLSLFGRHNEPSYFHNPIAF